MTFDVFGAVVPPQLLNDRSFAIFAASCRHCGRAITVRFRPDTATTPDNLRPRIEALCLSHAAITVPWLIRLETWPAEEAAAIPSDLPPEVERAFVQAERNFALPDCEEAAGMMYRRALEVGLKIAYPTMTGALAARIRKLVQDHHLPAPIGDWLDQVRLIGNDSAHDVDGVTREDLEAARGFVDTALRYIFTLPAQIAARRGLPVQVA